MDICGRDDVLLVFTCFWAKKLISADVMIFFCLHLLLGKKMDICGRDDLFFGLHLLLGGKMDVCGHDDPQRTCPPFA